MWHRVRLLCVFVLLLCLTFSSGLCASASVGAAGGPEEVKVPIILEVPYAIAGAEFEIEYTPGLKFLSFEKSEAIRSASTTPVVAKNGKTYLGFYNGTNDYVPVNGVLDVGYLVFEYSGEPNQSVIVTEAKYVQVVDKDNTNSELLIINEEIAVPLASGAGLKIGKKSYTMWIVLAAAVVLAAAGFVFYKKKIKGVKLPKED